MKTIFLFTLCFSLMGASAQNVNLAGNPLTQYPYFEYVKAINENSTVSIGVDIASQPQLTGKTGDVYIVESKTKTEWIGDNILSDVTNGGFSSVTFNGSTIQENTFSVCSPLELSSLKWVTATNNNTGLGHGYDVVIDMNQNGIYDSGDLIDGLEDEAGFYMVHDVTLAGPLAVTTSASYDVGTIFNIPSDQTKEILYYPTNIGIMQALPLIVIGHGSGHEYTWYDHIAKHMASYGYIVMAHENIPLGTTHNHTDAILELQNTIIGGVLAGKIDANRIIWIGHSHGAVNLPKSYHKIVTGDYTPKNYTAQSIILMSAMAGPGGKVDKGDLPHDANFHIWTASGDDLVNGAANFDLNQTYQLYERAEGWRMSTTVQGTGHAWFHNGEERIEGFPNVFTWFEGPCSIEKEGTHLVQKGLFLPLIKYFAEKNIPAEDFLYRQYENFHPIGVDVSNPCFVVTNDCRPDPKSTDVSVIDDFQSNNAPSQSSSGAAITYNVENLTEGRLDDNNNDFTWLSSDPFNGATQASPLDDSRGVVFDWNSDNKFYQWKMSLSQQDFSSFKYISLRACQVTQHPFTLDVLGDLSFTFTLIDENNEESSINISAYGGGIEQPYQRQGGWHNEFERIQIQLNDFLRNGNNLDLTKVKYVRLNFGQSWGSSMGRLIIDELLLNSKTENIISGISSNTNTPEISLYPNPTTDKIIISGLNISHVSVLNLLGETVTTKEVNTSQLEIDLSNQPTGIYFIQIISEEKQTVKQIIKE